VLIGLDLMPTALSQFLIVVADRRIRALERISDYAPVALLAAALLRDLKRINSHLVEGAAYPLLRSTGALPLTRLRTVALRS
jgi:hypothetical protein